MNINDIFRLYRNEAGADGADGGGSGDGKGGDAGAGGGDGKGGNASATGLLGDAAARAATEAAAAAAKANGKPTRPEDVPEQFWDVEKGELKTTALVKSWKDTRSELDKAKKAGSPKALEKAEDYKFNIPNGSDGKPIPLQVEPNDQAVKLAQTAAHAAGISQDQFDKFMGAFITGAAPLMPQPVDLEKEKASLGANADAVIAAVHAWGQNLVDTGLWSKDEFQEIIYMGSTAVGIRALNKLREQTGEKPIPLDAVVSDSLPSKEELYSMVNDPKYQNDPAFRAKVDEDFRKVFGTQAAGTSERGLGVGRGTSAARGFGS